MKNKILLLALALSASSSLLLAQDATPPADGQQPPAGEHGGPRGPRGGIHLLPPGAEQKLNLTEDQKTQIAALETEVRAKMEKILTPEQMAQLKKMHPPGRRGGGPGSEGGNGGPGGPGGGPGDGPQGGPDGAPAGPGGDAHPPMGNQ